MSGVCGATGEQFRLSNSRRASAPLFFAARGRPSSSLFLGQKTRGSGAPIDASVFVKPRILRCAGASRRSTGGDFKSPAPRFLGRGKRPVPVQRSSSRSGRSAARAGCRGPPVPRLRSETAGAASARAICGPARDVRGLNLRPLHHPAAPSSRRLMMTPSEIEQDALGLYCYRNFVPIMDLTPQGT